MAGASIEAHGFDQLRRDLNALARDLPKAVGRALQGEAGEVAREAGELAPKLTGELADHYRASSRGEIAVIENPLPQAGVWEGGGVIHPRGAPIRIPRAAPVTTALEHRTPELLDAVEQAIDQAASRHGWH